MGTLQRLIRLAIYLVARRNIRIGRKSYISASVRMETEGGSIAIGQRTRIDVGCILSALRGRIEIGDDVSINPYCVLYGAGGLSIGNDCRIATGVVMIPASHVFVDPSLPIRQQGYTRKGISIEEDVWIGTGAKILDGVSIGKGSVIGAGAVVNRDIPPYSVAAGVPARVIKRRDGGNSQNRAG